MAEAAAGREAGVGPAYVAMLVGFAQALRDEGLTIGSGDVVTYNEAVATLDPTDLVDLYWAGRSTLVTRPEQGATYRRVFDRYFLDGEREPGGRLPFTAQQQLDARAALEVPDNEGRGEERDRQEARLGLVASGTRTVRRKAFSACSPEELAALRRILRTMRLSPPRRLSRRTTPARRGRSPDVRRTVRETLRRHGDLADLRWRGRRLRHRRLVFILDVSGSMADYSRNLAQFAHTTTRTSARTEVFCFGTRLTRITRELDRRRPDDALDRAADAVLDWDGGTQIGACLDRFVRDHARRGMARGGIVVVCSDGLDRGDPDLLESAMERLSRLCHRIVWVNPHKGRTRDWTPTTLGMIAAAPHVDVMVSGHDLASLEEFARTLAGMR